jgi:hypothetical protein
MATVTDDQGNVWELRNGQWVLVRGRPPAEHRDPSLVDLAKQKAVDKATNYATNKAGDYLSNLVTGAGAGTAAANLAAPAAATATTGLGIAGAGTAAAPALSGADMAAGVAGGAAPSMFALKGIGSAGNVILPAAGAYGLYDLYSNPTRVGTGKGYLEGAASGAAIGSYFGPVGAGVGAGLGLLANVLGIGGESRTKGEEKLRDKLEEQGIVVPNSDTKEWENNPVFRESRQESDLTGKDIIHAADFYAQIPGYDKLNATKQEALANEALKRGLVQEKLGKINLSLDSAYQDFIKNQLTPTPQPQTQNREIASENARRRKKATLDAIMPEIMAPVTKSPRYDLNPGALINNPYL